MSREMKHSGIPWIGEIPKGWKRIFLKHYFHFEKGKNAAIYTQEYIGSNLGDFPVYSGQTENQGIMGRINTFDYDESECLFTTTVGAKVMTPKILQGKFSLSQNCLIMKKIKDASVHWFFYGLYALFDYEKSLIPSYMQPSLRIEDLKKYILYIPSITEQQKIASFLDRKCAEIDEMIALQERIVEELKAYKQSVITEVVTKGLNPDVPMKDSGIEWIGEIPEHWEVLKSKKILLSNDGGVWGEEPDGIDDTVVLRSTEQDIDGKLIIIEPAKRKLSIKEREASLLKRGDLIITKSSGSPSHIGKTSIIDEGVENLGCCYSNFIQRIRVKGKPKYYWYIFNSLIVKKQFEYLSTTTTGINNINSKIIEALFLPCTSAEEQESIALYLDTKCTEIDNLISIKLSKIDSLKEYKKSIIYEYVTGKKEVIE